MATQSALAPGSPPIQLDAADLSDDARARVQPDFDQDVLPMSVLRDNHGTDPVALLARAAHL